MDSPADGTARPEGLPKDKRIAKRRDFLRVYETGQKFFSRYAVVFYASNDMAHSRVGITATKKLGKANVRNRLKRWTREIYRRRKRTHGFLVRMRSKDGQAVLSRRRRKGRKRLSV